MTQIYQLFECYLLQIGGIYIRIIEYSFLFNGTSEKILSYFLKYSKYCKLTCMQTSATDCNCKLIIHSCSSASLKEQIPQDSLMNRKMCSRCKYDLSNRKTQDQTSIEFDQIANFLCTRFPLLFERSICGCNAKRSKFQKVLVYALTAIQRVEFIFVGIGKNIEKNF